MKRSFKLLLATVAIMAVLCAGAALAATENSVPYLDSSRTSKAIV